MWPTKGLKMLIEAVLAYVCCSFKWSSCKKKKEFCIWIQFDENKIKIVSACQFHEKTIKIVYYVVKSMSTRCLVVNDIWAATWQNQQNGYVPSEDSDQPGHPPIQIRVFAIRMKKAWILSYPLSAQRRLWSDWADDHADLSPRWAHTHFVGFVMSWLIFLFRFLCCVGNGRNRSASDCGLVWNHSLP